MVSNVEHDSTTLVTLVTQGATCMQVLALIVHKDSISGTSLSGRKLYEAGDFLCVLARFTDRFCNLFSGGGSCERELYVRFSNSRSSKF
jgi:hypothetical protein